MAINNCLVINLFEFSLKYKYKINTNLCVSHFYLKLIMYFRIMIKYISHFK